MCVDSTALLSARVVQSADVAVDRRSGGADHRTARPLLFRRGGGPVCGADGVESVVCWTRGARGMRKNVY